MWYNRVVQDLAQIPPFIDYYEKQLIAAKGEIKIAGKVERALSDLPGITEYRFNQLQEVEAVLNYLNIQLRKIRQKHYKKYLEAYQRALTSRDAEKYADGEQEVIDMELLVNEIAFLRNRYLSVMKGLDQKSYMVGHIVKLRVVGLEDATL